MTEGSPEHDESDRLTDEERAEGRARLVAALADLLAEDESTPEAET